MISPLWVVLPAIGYLSAALLIFSRQLTGGESFPRVGRALTWVSVAAHLLFVGNRLYHMPAAPLTGAREFSLLLALLLVVAFLLTGRWLRGAGIGEFVLGVAGVTLLVLVPSLPLRPEPVPAALMSPWLALHVPLLLLAYLMYALAGSAGAMYIVVSGLLKARRRLTLWRNLPTLESLDRFANHMAQVGFLLLTAGLWAGMMWSHQLWGHLIPEWPKQAVALATWGVYAAYFHARLVHRFRGRFCAWLLVAGFVLAVIGMIVPAMTGGPHKFI